ncbi:MAG TPA: DinB family protein [Candidatus Acidoferrales bacterium]|nr:DinB family protein [Candidatus Acidoferrales bacterium]
MKRAILPIAAAIILIAACLPAQQASQDEANPVSSDVRQIVSREAKNIMGAAEEMPADKYSYHPTPQQMTFGHLVLHMANSNNGLCSKISGMSAPDGEKLTDTAPKEKLVTALKASFDFCTQALSKVDDSKLGEQITLFGTRKTTRAAAMISLTDDFYDHYSTAAMYLRMNGLLPPTARRARPE